MAGPRRAAQRQRCGHPARGHCIVPVRGEPRIERALALQAQFRARLEETQEPRAVRRETRALEELFIRRKTVAASSPGTSSGKDGTKTEKGQPVTESHAGHPLANGFG